MNQRTLWMYIAAVAIIIFAYLFMRTPKEEEQAEPANMSVTMYACEGGEPHRTLVLTEENGGADMNRPLGTLVFAG